jgi:hypothetical protein
VSFYDPHQILGLFHHIIQDIIAIVIPGCNGMTIPLADASGNEGGQS